MLTLQQHLRLQKAQMLKSVQKQKEKDGAYDCVIKRDLNSPNFIFFDGEVSDDLQYFPTKIIQQNNGGNKA